MKKRKNSIDKIKCPAANDFSAVLNNLQRLMIIKKLIGALKL